MRFLEIYPYTLILVLCILLYVREVDNVGFPRLYQIKMQSLQDSVGFLF